MLSKFFERYLCSLNRMHKLKIYPDPTVIFDPFGMGNRYKLISGFSQNPLVGMMEGHTATDNGVYTDYFIHKYPNIPPNVRINIVDSFISASIGKSLNPAIRLPPSLKEEILRFGYFLYFYRKQNTRDAKYEIDQMRSFKLKQNIKDITIKNCSELNNL